MAAFTAIAAGVGMAATAGATGMSFAQAAKAKDAKIKADEEAAKMMDEARRRVNVNPFAAISLPMEAYQLESQANLQQGAQLTEAGRESERGVAATAGRVQMAQQEAQADIRAQAAQDKYRLDVAKAEGEADIRDALTKIDLAEAEGAQVAAAQFQNQYNQNIKQGVEGIASLAGQAAAAAPLFEKTEGARQFAKFEKDYGKMVEAGTVPKELISATGNPLSAADAYAKMTMSPQQYMELGTQVTREDMYGDKFRAFEVNPYELRGAAADMAEQTKAARKALKNYDQDSPMFRDMDVDFTDLGYRAIPTKK